MRLAANKDGKRGPFQLGKGGEAEAYSGVCSVEHVYSYPVLVRSLTTRRLTLALVGGSNGPHGFS